jgi:uncharacterized C2H2 Zn-finger protein
MSKIIESESADISQVEKLRRSMVKRCMERTFNAAKVLTISDKNLAKSTGYLECQDFNVKINDLINYYESMSAKPTLKNKNPLKKRKGTVLEGISALETNKLTEFTDNYFQISEDGRKKIKKNVEEENCVENSHEEEDPYYYLEINSCPEIVQDRSFGLIDDNFSLPNHECLNLSHAEQFVFDNEMVHKKIEQLDGNNPVISKETEFKHWKITNKHKVYEDELFSNREKLYVQRDDKGRVNGYHVKLLLSTSEEDGEEHLDAEELKALNALSQHSNVFNQPVNFDNNEELNKVTYTNFVYPSKDLAEDLLRCTKCDLTPNYYQIVRRLFDCARLGDFASLADKQKFLNAARTKRKNKEQEEAKKKVKRAAAAKATRAPVRTVSPAPKKNYTFKRKIKSKSKEPAKRKNLTESVSNKIEPNVNIVEPIKETINDVKENELETENIEPKPMADELKENVKHEVELKKINTNRFDDKRAELISMGLLPSFLDPDILNEESEVGKLVKTELTSMGLLPAETNCASIEKVNRNKVKKFKCDKCDATFTSSNGKKYHINKVHTTEKDLIEKPYKCLEDGCLKKFTSKNGVKSHTKIKHPAKNSQ